MGNIPLQLIVDALILWSGWILAAILLIVSALLHAGRIEDKEEINAVYQKLDRALGRSDAEAPASNALLKQECA